MTDPVNVDQNDEGADEVGARTDDASTPENVESRPATTDGVGQSGQGGVE